MFETTFLLLSDSYIENLKSNHLLIEENEAILAY